MLHVAIYQPSIPPNTGNLARQCVGMNAHMHIIGPAAFDLSAKAARRAGLDYWPHLQMTIHESPGAFLDWLGERMLWLVSKYGRTRYDQADYADGDVLLFGNELKGVPDDWQQRFAQHSVYIPIMGQIRSYNLTNAASIVMAQACRHARLYPESH